MHSRLIAVTSAVSLAVGLAVATPGAPVAAAGSLCGSMAGTPSHITKVVWIAMENRSYGSDTDEIPGSPSDPYIKNTLTAQCGSASNFHASTHPSYPNYLALTSGSVHNHYSDSLAYFTGRSIFSQVDPSWRGYEEFMSTPCDHTFQTGTSPDYYLGRHNPAASYSSLPVGAPTAGDCVTNDVPMGTTTTGALHDDATSGNLPAFSLITPGLCNDMHAVPAGDTSCPDQIKGGDDWLATWIPILTSSPDYTSGHLMIDVVWDEGRGEIEGTGDPDDCTNSSDSDCIVPNLVISPYTTPVVSNANFSHYSLLKTTEEILGVPFLGHAADASTADMCAPYGICPPASSEQPRARFTGRCHRLRCRFDASRSRAPDSSITHYVWHFGDGSAGKGVTRRHTFAAHRTYSVRLTVTNAEHESASVTHSFALRTRHIRFRRATAVAGNAATAGR